MSWIANLFQEEAASIDVLHLMMRRRSWLYLSLAGLVACGSVKTGSLPDAPLAPDAPGSDPTDGSNTNTGDAGVRGTVRVTVLEPGGTGAPAVGATVVFLDPDGTLVKRVATTTAGKADAEVLPGASVTSIALGASYQIQTVLAVKPGDDVVLGSKPNTATGTFTVNYPAFANAISYAIAEPCGNLTVTSSDPKIPPPTSGDFTLNDSCATSPMEIVITPMDVNLVPLATISKAGVPFSNGGSTTIVGEYQPLRTFKASYTNIDPAITALTVTRAVPDGFGLSANQTAQPPAATAIAMNLSGALGTNARISTRVTSATLSISEVRQNIAGISATYGLDVGATRLPWINRPTYDAATSKITVPLDTTGITGTGNTRPDVFLTTMTYQRADSTGTKTAYAWTVFAPDAGDITLPTLPPEDASIAPLATDTFAAISAAMFDADTVTSYDAIRNDLNRAFLVYGGGRPPADTVRLSVTPPVRRILALR